MNTNKEGFAIWNIYDQRFEKSLLGKHFFETEELATTSMKNLLEFQYYEEELVVVPVVMQLDWK